MGAEWPYVNQHIWPFAISMVTYDGEEISPDHEERFMEYSDIDEVDGLRDLEEQDEWRGESGDEEAENGEVLLSLIDESSRSDLD